MAGMTASEGIEMAYGDRKSFDFSAIVSQGVKSAISAEVFAEAGYRD